MASFGSGSWIPLLQKYFRAGISVERNNRLTNEFENNSTNRCEECAKDPTRRNPESESDDPKFSVGVQF